MTDHDFPYRRQAFFTAAYTVVGVVAAVLVWALRDVLMLIGFAAVLAFALDPGVAWLTSLRLPRGRFSTGRISRRSAAALILLALAGLGIWVIVWLVPQVVEELSAFVEHAPENLERLVAWVREQALSRGWTSLADFRGPDVAALLRTAGTALLAAVGRGLGSLGALVGLILLPTLTYFLLTDRAAVEGSALDFVPETARPGLRKAMRSVALALRGYVRGQSLVCATVGVAGWLAFWALGLPASVLLGVIVGLAEVIPILGFWIASIAIVLAGWSISPSTAAWAFIAYMAINQLVAVFVTPRVMGLHLRMHPFVVMVSILAGGTLLGAAGAILALPVAAALQTLMAEFAPRTARSSRQGPA